MFGLERVEDIAFALTGLQSAHHGFGGLFDAGADGHFGFPDKVSLCATLGLDASCMSGGNIAGHATRGENSRETPRNVTAKVALSLHTPKEDIMTTSSGHTSAILASKVKG